MIGQPPVIESVLIVDDSEDQRTWATRSLWSVFGSSLRIETAEGISDAQEIVARRPPSLVLLDLRLRTSDARETSAMVGRLAPIWPPIVCFTNAASAEEVEGLRRACMSNGAEDFVLKLDVTLPECLAAMCVNAVLRRRARRT